MSRVGVSWWGAGALVLAGAVALFMGVLLALWPVQGAVMILGLGALAGVLIAPWPLLLWTFLFTVAVVVGPLQYAAGFSKAFWLPYLMGVLMGMRALADGMGRSAPLALQTAGAPPPRVQQLDTAMRCGWLCMGLLAVVALASSLSHGVGPMQALVSGKEYLFLWSLPLAFGLGLVHLGHLRLMWLAMAIWLAVQALVVVWQRLVVAPQRGGDAPWDAVVGLFAGKANGAGGSGTMAMVSLWAAASVLMAWRAGLLSGWWAAVASASALLACALAEVKVAVLLLPLMALAVWWSPGVGDSSVKPLVGNGVGSWAGRGVDSRGGSALSREGRPRPGRQALVGALGLLTALVLSLALMWAHRLQFTAQGSADATSSLHYAQTVFDRNLNAQAVADEHGQLTRLGALQYWWKRQSISDVPGWLIGHGIGAVRRSQLAPGALVRGLRLDPGRSSAAILLWETGVLGLLAWGGFTLAWMAAALEMMRSASSRHERVCLRAAAVVMGVTLLSLPYGADLFEAPHLAVAYLLGVAMVWGVHRQRSRSEPTRFSCRPDLELTGQGVPSAARGVA